MSRISTSGRLTRRSFLKRSAACGAAALAVPAIGPSAALGKDGRSPPSDRITVACIGTGNRGSAVMGEFLGQKDVQIVAVCDVKQWVREEARQRVDSHYGNRACAAYNDFRELLDRGDIDAVLVASTDHWHVLHSLAAVRSGRDVYMEKPMGVSFEQDLELLEEVNRRGRVFQFGTQQRSDPKFRLACELALNERIGKLRAVNVWSPGSSSGGSTEPVPVPEGLDYDLWLGPAPYKPYTKDRCSNSLWWFISDYALGFIAGWGIHPMDIAVWGAGDKLACPATVEGTGKFPAEGVCDTAMNWRVKLEFRSGVTIDFAGDPRPAEWTQRYGKTTSHGTAFEGTEGWVHVNRGVVNSHPEDLVREGVKEGIRLYESHGHVRNFLDCVKSRKKTVCPIEEAVRAESLCYVSDVAIRLGRKLEWDPARWRFASDGEANGRLTRPLRAPWKL